MAIEGKVFTHLLIYSGVEDDRKEFDEDMQRLAVETEKQEWGQPNDVPQEKRPIDTLCSKKSLVRNSSLKEQLSKVLTGTMSITPKLYNSVEAGNVSITS